MKNSTLRGHCNLWYCLFCDLQHSLTLTEEFLKCTKVGRHGINKEKGPIVQRTGNWVQFTEDATPGPATHEKCECPGVGDA